MHRSFQHGCTVSGRLYIRLHVYALKLAIWFYRRPSVTVPLNQNQFDALVSLTYNIGSGAFNNSTLLKKLNKGDYQGAADQFLVWNKAGGKVMKGLVRRREAEQALFLKK